MVGRSIGPQQRRAAPIDLHAIERQLGQRLGIALHGKVWWQLTRLLITDTVVDVCACDFTIKG